MFTYSLYLDEVSVIRLRNLYMHNRFHKMSLQDLLFFGDVDNIFLLKEYYLFFLTDSQLH